MDDILKLIIESLVENKDAISIEKEENDYKITYKVKVDNSEMGKVIGKNGRIATAVKTLMQSVGAKDHKKVFVEFID